MALSIEKLSHAISTSHDPFHGPLSPAQPLKSHSNTRNMELTITPDQPRASPLSYTGPSSTVAHVAGRKFGIGI
ncbi:uncharacterized protein P174DRAFT_442604 [Aspergillus novofumigatus IBT 16806]|uniref:Uncharacterized protein n=1 Tax=Aspergillus novofumigatus (strain IBT 16806) TaxID=1392255 RepID=A0A2I1C571_ASPN1|nr:uncharacterized protein P174DRAFT_442604 [Aspergillus novofumigatus IBT 16806]PKX92735.1 hypothetical protein P174DRAFT_442604 [Aspergillus novofumigatus IBT 16806]